jgi:chaperone LolA
MRHFWIGIVIGSCALASAASAMPQAALDSPDKPDFGSHAASRSDAPPEPVKSPVADEKKAAEIARVEAYLSGISSIVADFNQTSADGSTGSGKFYLKRPGKMRWQYNPPTPILLVSNGTTITYYDASLDQVSYVGVDDTMAGFLAQKTIKLESDSTHLTHFEDENGVIRATLVQKKKPDEGSLTLELSDNPLQLKQMVVVDATGNATHIQLQNAQYGPVLDDKLFIFEDPRGVTPRKKKL